MMRPVGGLLLIVACLLSIGVIMVSSAGLTIDGNEPVTLQSILLGRPAVHALLAAAALGLGATVRVDRLAGARWMPFLAAAIVLLLLAVYVPGLGREVNGARRWLDLRVTSFQPSEAAKWAMPVILAWYCAGQARVLGRIGAGFVGPMCFVALVCGLIALEDLGTAVLIGVVSVGVLVAAGARVVHVAALVPPGLAAVALAIFSSPYRLDRMRAFIDPYQDPQGIGYHVIHSLTTVAGGGLTGRGLGNSIQKFGYLPEDTTDFIFAIICEELGLVGSAVVVSLYAGLLLLGWAIVGRAANPFCRLLGIGILLTIGLQATINIAVVTGLAPTKGIALPLVSAGGTGWLLTAFSLGLVVAIAREKGDSPLFLKKGTVPFFSLP